MIQKIIVVHAKDVDFNQENGDQIKGTSLYYLLAEVTPAKGEHGYPPVKAWLNPAAAKGIEKVPGVYDGAFSVQMKDGKAQLRLASVAFLAEVELAL